MNRFGKHNQPPIKRPGQARFVQGQQIEVRYKRETVMATCLHHPSANKIYVKINKTGEKTHRPTFRQHAWIISGSFKDHTWILPGFVMDHFWIFPGSYSDLVLDHRWIIDGS